MIRFDLIFNRILAIQICFDKLLSINHFTNYTEVIDKMTNCNCNAEKTLFQKGFLRNPFSFLRRYVYTCFIIICSFTFTPFNFESLVSKFFVFLSSTSYVVLNYLYLKFFCNFVV